MAVQATHLQDCDQRSRRSSKDSLSRSSSNDSTPTQTPTLEIPQIFGPEAVEPTAVKPARSATSAKPAKSPTFAFIASEQMPPPPKPSLSPAANARRLPISSSSSISPGGLRIPTTGPLPIRLPPVSSNSSSLRPPTVPASTSTLSPASRARRTVMLKPGHSPLDWAHLTTTTPGPTLRGVPALISVPPSLLKEHNGRKGKPAWAVYRGKVYNMTPYLDFHPGGRGELLRGAGNNEGERLFGEIHPWVNWEGLLGNCCVGVLVPENEANEGLDDMD